MQSRIIKNLEKDFKNKLKYIFGYSSVYNYSYTLIQMNDIRIHFNCKKYDTMCFSHKISEIYKRMIEG